MSIIYKKPVVHVLTIATGLYLAYYIFWRAAYTLNTEAFVFSLILLIAEIMGVINFYLFAMMTWDTDSKPAPEPLKDVTVDVFVPTYNEDISVLEATMVGCMRMRMHHKTYLLDDGRREEVKALAAKIGCGYLTREDNKHAKAGNINAALPRTNGEFIVVLDADMVPQPDFLEKTLGYFRDEKTAIVQMPQEFYNLDSMQHNKHGSYWHEQQLFYHVIQPGKNNINAAFWCGSPSIVRRAALESIGGVATDSITEDFLTSIRLNAAGWRIRYHHETLAFGIAPQSFHAFSVQRLRWAQGSMKIMRSKDNPLIKRGLTMRQRLSHFAAIFTYFDAYQKLIYLLTPAILLVTGLMPLKTDMGMEFVWHWIPYFLLTMLTNSALGREYFNFIAVEKFNTLKMVTFIKASLSLLWSKNIFRVTPKSANASVKKKDRKELRIQFIILIIIAGAMVFAIINTLYGAFVIYPSTATMAVAMFWSFVNGAIIAMALHEVLKRMYARQDYRFVVSLQGSIAGKNGRAYNAEISNISRGGVSLRYQGEEVEKHTDVCICLPDGPLDVPGDIVFARALQNGVRTIGFKFDKMSNLSRERLYYFLFVENPRRIYNEGGMSPLSRNAKARRWREQSAS